MLLLLNGGVFGRLLLRTIYTTIIFALWEYFCEVENERDRRERGEKERNDKKIFLLKNCIECNLIASRRK